MRRETPKDGAADRIRRELEALADPAYRDFQAKLVPTVDPARILGVRTPTLRDYARRLACERPEEARAFLEALPHETYDENNLHGELIGRMAKTPAEAFELLDAFLPHVDNWATCDITASAMTALGRNPESVMPHIERWLRATHAYTVRFGIVVLLDHYLGEGFEPRHLALVADVRSDEYYINMARAWYFSTALAKQYNAAMPYFTERRLDRWTHNKSLQKARESFRVSPDRKIRLQQLKY